MSGDNKSVIASGRLVAHNERSNTGVPTNLSDEFDGEELRNRMLQDHACLIRNCGNKLGASKQYFRIAARPVEDIHYLVAALKDVLAGMKAE